MSGPSMTGLPFLSEFVVLRQLVGYGIPSSLGGDENMCGWADSRSVYKRSQSNVNELDPTNHGEHKATACFAMNIVRRNLVTENQQVALPLSNVQLVTLDPCEWLECRAGCAPTV
jgi:hypothetical protein